MTRAFTIATATGLMLVMPGHALAGVSLPSGGPTPTTIVPLDQKKVRRAARTPVPTDEEPVDGDPADTLDDAA